MITSKLIDDLKKCSVGSIKKIVFNDKHEFINFQILNDTGTDNINIVLFVKIDMGINKIENIKIYNDKDEVIVERNTNTIVNTDFYYKFTLRFTTKEGRLFMNAI